MSLRIGQGFDFHPLVEGRRLVLGGVEIHHSSGLQGHSDADVAVHALANAILGAVGEDEVRSAFRRGAGLAGRGMGGGRTVVGGGAGRGRP